MSWMGNGAIHLSCGSGGESRIIILAVLNQTAAWGTLVSGSSGTVTWCLWHCLWLVSDSGLRWAGTENWNTWAGFSLHAAISAAHWYWTSHFLFEAALFTRQRAIFTGGCSAQLSSTMKRTRCLEHMSQLGPNFSACLLGCTVGSDSDLFELCWLFFSYNATGILTSSLFFFIRLYSGLLLSDVWDTSCGRLVLGKAKSSVGV